MRSTNNRRARRQVQREAENLAAQNEQEELLIQALNDEKEQMKEALEIAEEQMANYSARNLAEAASQAKMRDAAQEVAQQTIDEETERFSNGDAIVSPAIEDVNTNSQPAEEEWHPSRKIRTRYVMRGTQYHRAKNLKTLKIGEPVFCRQGSKFVKVGKVNSNRQLPIVYKED